MRCYGYIRCSSFTQLFGTTLSEQKRQIESYCQLKKLDLLAIIVDPAIKGEIPIHLRPQGKKLVDAIDNGIIDTVCVTRLDRAFRSASDCLNMSEQWSRKGISLRILNFAGQEVNTSTAVGKLWLTMMAGVSEFEKNLTKERCAEGREARRAEGKVIGGLRFGYDLDDDKRLIPNQTEQQIIESIKTMKMNKFSLSKIANRLNNRGYTTKKGKPWTFGSVHTILKSNSI